MKKILLTAILSFSVQLLLAQERLVSGVVRDSIGILPGANVLVQGTHKETQTDFDGKFYIKATEKDSLTVSFVGYKTKKVKAEPTQLDVTLQRGPELVEVVGPAYYPKPKNAVFGAIQIVSAKDIENSENPKYQFKKNSERNIYIFFVTATEVQYPNDKSFHEKYNVTYSMIGSHSAVYVKRYNKLTFKYMSKKYGKDWQLEVRNDVVGLNELLK